MWKNNRSSQNTAQALLILGLFATLVLGMAACQLQSNRANVASTLSDTTSSMGMLAAQNTQPDLSNMTRQQLRTELEWLAHRARLHESLRQFLYVLYHNKSSDLYQRMLAMPYYHSSNDAVSADYVYVITYIEDAGTTASMMTKYLLTVFDKKPLKSIRSDLKRIRDDLAKADARRSKSLVILARVEGETDPVRLQIIKTGIFSEKLLEVEDNSDNKQEKDSQPSP